MIICVRVNHETLECVISSKAGIIWEGRAIPYVLQWQADRRVAYFQASDLPCLHPSGLPVITGDTQEKF